MTPEALSEIRKKAGSLGGRATVAKYGRSYMAEIGRRGAEALYKRYNLVPAGVAGWALVDRENGKVKAAWAGGFY